MELTQDKLDLIRKSIYSSNKYSSNEDLFEDFYNEAYKRSFLIMKSVTNEASLQMYLKKVVSTSITSVLQNSGRVRRTVEGFVSTNEKSLDEVKYNRFSGVKISYDFIDLKDTPEEIVVKKDVLNTVYEAVLAADGQDKAKSYLQLYKLRYVNEMKQVDIARELNLSQSEVSKRLLELMEHVKKSFN